ncbi:N-acetylmuramoyl-L-alanine amidase [Fibrella aquatica]|uniref:N-acetylmuramoyl-L-alanine amidase n=1 Tax=Fibrella aquatica TaxID=3242487 RepID=UPI0035217ACC
MKTGLVYILLLMASWASAQSLRQSERRELFAHPDQRLLITYDQPYSSALVYAAVGQSLHGTYLIAAGDTVRLQTDLHAPAGQLMSALCVFRHPVSQLALMTGTLAGEVTIQTLYAPPLPNGYIQDQMHSSARLRDDCGKPDVVPAAVWRQGLTAPKSLPTQTKVQFVIVHHSAGSNATTNFTEEVRNIYLQHTQLNGWNDVGYNFLIGRDGVIYEGRDGQGVMDGDNVLGAHFCAQNSGTVGICLMGNFNDSQPSAISLASLNQLIGWKLKKENLQPIGVAFHPGSAKQLNLISGHRDGVCATECPGSNLYASLPTIRDAVSKTCSFTSTGAPVILATEPTETDWIVYPNPTRGAFFVQHKTLNPSQVRFELIDVQGKMWPVSAAIVGADRWRLTTETPITGMFWLRCADESTTTVKPIWRSLE